MRVFGVSCPSNTASRVVLVVSRPLPSSWIRNARACMVSGRKPSIMLQHIQPAGGAEDGLFACKPSLFRQSSDQTQLKVTAPARTFETKSVADWSNPGGRGSCDVMWWWCWWWWDGPADRLFTSVHVPASASDCTVRSAASKRLPRFAGAGHPWKMEDFSPTTIAAQHLPSYRRRSIRDTFCTIDSICRKLHLLLRIVGLN
jgi:hypothetical protein